VWIINGNRKVKELSRFIDTSYSTGCHSSSRMTGCVSLRVLA